MTKKNGQQAETEWRHLDDDALLRKGNRLAENLKEQKTLKEQLARESARVRGRLKELEEEEATLIVNITTRQEEIEVKRQMSFSEVEDEARHEVSLKDFDKETGEYLFRKYEDLRIELEQDSDGSGIGYDELKEEHDVAKREWERWAADREAEAEEIIAAYRGSEQTKQAKAAGEEG